jgi:hypothetical protein
MSKRSPNFAKKRSVLERMVADTPDLSVILLQGVVACAMEYVAERLRTCTADSGWAAFGCGSSANGTLHPHSKVGGAIYQTAWYTASQVACLADSYLGNDSNISMAFRREPYVCNFQPISQSHLELCYPRSFCVLQTVKFFSEPLGKNFISYLTSCMQ